MARDFFPAGPILDDYLSDDHVPVRIIQGPIESGKSVTSAMILYSLMCTMPRWRDGKRRSRWLITRNTYPDLRGSTVETWLYWFPPEVYGRFIESEPYLHEMRFLDVEADVWFESYADDSEQTIRSLRSKEYTGGWANEAQFMPRRLITEIASRTGRYPPKIEIEHERPDGLTQCMICDLNAPHSDDHWTLRMRGDSPLPLDMPHEEAMQYKKPAGWKFYHQPEAVTAIYGADGQTIDGYAVNPLAENLAHMSDGARSTIEMDQAEIDGVELRPHRYIELVGAKTQDEIDRDLRGKVVKLKLGAPATPQFRKERHVGPATMRPMPGVQVVLGADHGLTPACLFAQQINGGWVVFDELVETNMDTLNFSPLVAAKLASEFPDSEYVAWGDPAGDWRGQGIASTTFSLYAAEGIRMRPPALKDSPLKRLTAVRKCLSTEANNRPRLMVHPKCVYLISALDGGAQIKRNKTPDGMKITEEIIKNSASHVFDALGYLLWGGGEVRDMLKPAEGLKKAIVNAIPKRRKMFTARMLQR